MNLKKPVLTLLSLLFVGNLFAQNRAIDGILKRPVMANHFTVSLPNEKVYLHLDNSSYFLDETLWFKAYVVSADSNRFTKASEILHVELLTPEGAVIRSQKHRLRSGQCDGYITLDSALYSGYFEIRAYTKAMLNFDEQNYFSRVFPLFEKPKNRDDVKEGLRTLPRHRSTEYLYKSLSERQEVKIEKVRPNFSVEYYPEGGNLVASLKSDVAFQVKNRYGETVNSMCYLYSGKDVLLDSFSSTHLGMGSFQLAPQKGMKYYVRVKEDSKSGKYYLPKVFDTGHVVRVDNLSDSLNLKVSVVSTGFVDTLGVVILNRGRASSLTVVSPMVKDSVISLSFKKSNLREGVNQVVLYNSEGQELSSRMFFIQKSTSRCRLDVQVDKHSLKDSLLAYRRQELLVELKDSNNLGVSTTFSLSVCDSALHIPTFNRDNIYTNLLLSSELKGFIPNVDYYFESDDIAREKNLDFLLMVYGWSRCKWEYLSGYKKMDLKYLWEKGLAFYGRKYFHKWVNYSYFDGCTASFVTGITQIYGERICIPTDEIKMFQDTNKIKLLQIYADSVIYNKDKHGDIYSDEEIPYFSLSKTGSGHYIMDFDDFYGEIKLFLSPGSFVTNLHSKDGIFHPVIVTHSSYLPKEKPYQFFERMYRDQDTLSVRSIIDGEYVRQYALEEVNVYERANRCYHPSVKTHYYNRGFYSQLFPMFDLSIQEKVSAKRFHSIEEYKANYDTKATYYRTGELWTTHIQLYSPNEYLSYYKLPLGTITYIANATVDTCSLTDGGHFTIPIEQEYPELTGFNLDTSKYTYFIDSTIIHTDYAKREDVHNRFKSHRDYVQYEVQDILKYPSKTSSQNIPMYVIEHFVRIVKRKSQKYTRDDINKKRSYWLSWEKDQAPGYEFPANLAVLPWHAARERDQRIELFQGLTRVEKEFYSPDYSNEPLPKQGDYRRTLYWNPNVKTDSSGQARVVFYTNGSCKALKVDIQGLTEEGYIINKSEYIK